MKLISEFGRGKDKKKRVKRKVKLLKNLVLKEPGQSTQRAADIGGLTGLGVGTVIGAKALQVATNKNLLKNPHLSPVIIGAGTLGVLLPSAAIGAIGGIAVNNKIRKKSLYE